VNRIKPAGKKNLPLPAIGPDHLERRADGPAERVHAIVSRLQAHRLRSLAITEEVQLGPPVPAPMLSIIVPLYGRIDLIEHQLAQFAADSTWARCDLIYVLDSPADWERLAWRTEALARLYGLSLRLLRLNANGGYAAANNLAAIRARADMLLFLNSDVLPSAPGWIERMLATYRSRPRIGALGPKLLFEDNSIQHAGESFQSAGDGFAWDALPCFKGLHRDLPAANQPRRVPAVTGACLMVSRTRFESAGGFDQGYVQGDFEDMDFCLRLLKAGYENWYEPTVELYHLEEVSYPPIARRLQFGYNRWLLACRWAPVISKLTRETDPPPHADPQTTV
jgi:GT2 family glycosyltransferase